MVSISPSWAQGPPADLKASMYERREKLSVFSCKLETVHTAPSSLFVADAADSSSSNDDTVVYTSTRELMVDLTEGKFYSREMMPAFSQREGRFKEREMFEVFNGEKAFRYYLEGTFSKTGDGPADVGEISEESPRLKSFAYGPLFWHLGIFDPADFHKSAPTILDKSRFEWRHSGTTWTAQGLVGAAYYVFVFDANHGYNIIRSEMHPSTAGKSPSTSTPISTYLMDYVEEGGSWRLDRYQFTHATMGEKLTEVIELQSATVDPSIFELPGSFVQPGMLVVADGKAMQVASDGSKVPYIPGTPLHSRSNWWPTLTVMVIVCVLLSGTYFFYSRQWR